MLIFIFLSSRGVVTPLISITVVITIVITPVSIAIIVTLIMVVSILIIMILILIPASSEVIVVSSYIIGLTIMGISVYKLLNNIGI